MTTLEQKAMELFPPLGSYPEEHCNFNLLQQGRREGWIQAQRDIEKHLADWVGAECNKKIEEMLRSPVPIKTADLKSWSASAASTMVIETANLGLVRQFEEWATKPLTEHRSAFDRRWFLMRMEGSGTAQAYQARFTLQEYVAVEPAKPADPAKQETCEPPLEHRGKRWHWLRQINSRLDDGYNLIVMRWENGEWSNDDTYCFDAEYTWKDGYRYVAPCEEPKP